MRQRCLDKNHKWGRYGGRGITFDPSWEDFGTFLADMGDRPAGKTLDRKDNDLGYSKENCRWASSKEQANNRSDNTVLTYIGVSLNIAQWADRIGLPVNTLHSRLRRGWELERALSPMFYKKRKHEIN
jgi:hypothetical protein